MTTSSISHRVNPLRESPPGRGLSGKNFVASSTPIIPQCEINTRPNNAVTDHGRAVGYVRGNCLYRKMVGSKHILKNPPAIAIAVEALKQAIRAGAEIVLILDTESGLKYSCNVFDFNTKALLIDRGGYGEQMALPLGFWTITDPHGEARPGSGVADG